MASVCGGCLSLMDAGVPLKAHVAGIAMGLIKDGGRFAVLTDILGDEDHLGDMDFKVAGTDSGITALQMDIKINGITKEIMKVALDQAKEGRMHILGIMKTGGAGPARGDVQLRAAHHQDEDQPGQDPRRDRQGRQRDPGAHARDRHHDRHRGRRHHLHRLPVGRSRRGREEAHRAITAEVEVGKVYEGPVLRLLDFGAIVQLLPGKDGLLHISQIAHERVNAVSDYLKEGQIVKVKVLEADDKGRVRLSRKALLDPPAARGRRRRPAAARGNRHATAVSRDGPARIIHALACPHVRDGV